MPIRSMINSCSRIRMGILCDWRSARKRVSRCSPRHILFAPCRRINHFTYMYHQVANEIMWEDTPEKMGLCSLNAPVRFSNRENVVRATCIRRIHCASHCIVANVVGVSGKCTYHRVIRGFVTYIRLACFKLALSFNLPLYRKCNGYDSISFQYIE